MNIDIGNLRAFCVVAEKESFTLAGELLGATQSTISMRVKKLEQMLDHKLFDSSPHGVQLTDFGHDFMPRAQELLGAHDATLMDVTGHSEHRALRIGITGHAANDSLKDILSSIGKAYPHYRISLAISTTEELYTDIGRNKYDVVILRRAKGDIDGKQLYSGPLSWMASSELIFNDKAPVPLVSIASPCSLRQTAITALNTSKIPWRETFVGTSVTTVRSAISAGLGIACLDERNMPNDCIKAPEAWNLPDLPDSQIVMHETASARKQHGDLINKIEETFLMLYE